MEAPNPQMPPPAVQRWYSAPVAIAAYGALGVALLTILVLYLPLGLHTVVILAAAIAYVIILGKLSRVGPHWLKYLAWSMFALLGSCLLLPGLKAVGQLRPGTFGAIVLENTPWPVQLGILVALCFIIYLARRAERPEPLSQPAAPPPAPGNVKFDTAIESRVDSHNVTHAHAPVYNIEHAEIHNPPPATPAVAPTPPTPSPLHTISPAVADFTGRKTELQQLRNIVHSSSAAICGLRGLGGVGKTQLARKLAEELAPQYSDAQIELDLAATTTPLTPAAALARIINAFHPEAKLPDDEPTLHALYLQVLHNKRILILADNADNAAQVRPLLPPAGSLLLVTSRHHFLVPGLTAVNLNSLPEADAVELLQKISHCIADHAAPIARLCGRLPLALRAAASFLAVRTDIAPAAYLHDLADETRRLETLGVEGIEIGVEASLFLSYRQLSPAAQRVLRAMSIFPAPFDAPAEKAVCQDPAGQHLGELFRLSLVEFDEKDQHYRLHDLTRLFALRRLDEPPCADERLPAEQRHAQHFCTVLATAHELYEKGNAGVLEGLTLFDRERINIEAGQSWSAGHAETHGTAARLTIAYPDAGVYMLSLRLHPRQRINWLTSALVAARLLKDRAAEAAHLGNLGITHADLGDARKAIEFYEQALIIDREIGDRRGEGNDLGNLGNAHVRLGDARKAIEFYEQALIIDREIGDRHGEGSALGNLGIAHFDLGDARKAIEFYEQQLTIVREIGDRRGEGNALGNLANAHHALGDVRKAIECYEHALLIAREIGDRQGEASTSWNLGLLLVRQGEVERGLALMKVRVDYLRKLGHPDAEKAAAKVESLRPH